MKQTIFLSGYDIDSFLNEIESLLKRIVDEKFQEIQDKKPSGYLTRKEVAKLLNISLPTLHQWIKHGVLKSYRIGNRILFKSDEVDCSLKERKFRRTW